MSLKNDLTALMQRNTEQTVALVQKHINALLSGLSGLAEDTKPEAAIATPKTGKGKAAKAAPAPKAGKKTRKAKTLPHVNVDLAYEVARLCSGLTAAGVATIAEALGKTTTELERPIAIALDRKWISKSGERRATVYHPGTLPSTKPADAFPPPPKAAAPEADAAPPNGGIPVPAAGVPGTVPHAAPSAFASTT